MFSEDYLKYKHLLEKDRLLFIKMRVQPRYNQNELLELRINNISLLSEVLKKFVNEITLFISITDISEDLSDKIYKTMKKNSGKCNIKFSVFDHIEKTSVELPSRKIKVDPADFLSVIAKIPEVRVKIN